MYKIYNIFFIVQFFTLISICRNVRKILFTTDIRYDLMKRVIKIYLFRAERIAITNISKIVSPFLTKTNLLHQFIILHRNEISIQHHSTISKFIFKLMSKRKENIEYRHKSRF